MEQQDTYNITLKNLTAQQIALLRNATSDLGLDDKDCIRLQLAIANALLDADYMAENQ